MRRRVDPSPALLNLARRQGGALSRAQCLRSGLPASSIDRLVRSGGWERLAPGVFLASGDVSSMGLVWAGVLVAGEGAGVTGVAALWLAGLVDDIGLPVVVACERRVTDAGPWIFRRLGREVRGAPPRTSPAVAFLDAWPELRRDEARVVLGRMLQRRRATPDELARALASRSRIARRRDLERLLADAGVGIHSPLEARYADLVERAHRLPAASRQVASAAGVVDAEYAGFATVVELDGRRYHDDAFRDMRRDNAHLEAGVATLRYGWDDVTARPCDVARQVGRVLSARGWQGKLRLCARCRPR